MLSAASLAPAEALARLRLARTDGIGPLTFRRLLERHGTAVAALAALPRLAARRGAPFALHPEADAKREMEALHRMGARLLFAGIPPYPSLLDMQEDAPPILALLGARDRSELKRVATVAVRPDPALLPYNQPLLAFLRAEKARGRCIVLATAADRAPLSCAR